MSTADATPVVLRPTRFSLVWLPTLLVTQGTVYSVLSLLDGEKRDALLAGTSFLVLTVVAAGIAVWQARTAGVVVDRDGIEVRGIWTHRHSWSTVTDARRYINDVVSLRVEGRRFRVLVSGDLLVDGERRPAKDGINRVIALLDEAGITVEDSNCMR